VISRIFILLRNKFQPVIQRTVINGRGCGDSRKQCSWNTILHPESTVMMCTDKTQMLPLKLISKAQSGIKITKIFHSRLIEAIGKRNYCYQAREMITKSNIPGKCGFSKGRCLQLIWIFDDYGHSMNTVRRRFVSPEKSEKQRARCLLVRCWNADIALQSVFRTEVKEKITATKSVRRRRSSTQYPSREMRAQLFELSTEALLDLWKGHSRVKFNKFISHLVVWDSLSWAWDSVCWLCESQAH